MPAGVQAGVHAELVAATAASGGLLHAGEGWVARAHEIPRHTHDGWEFYLQLHGRSTWTVGRERHELAPGWLLAVPPGVPHHGATATRWRTRHHFVYAAVDLSVLGVRHPSLAQAWQAPRPCWSPQAGHLASTFRGLVAEVIEERAYADVALAAAVDLLVTEVTRALVDPRPGRPRIERNPAVARARQLLHDEYARPWTVTELAAACGLSRGRLAELFTAEVGQPPYEYLLDRRVERAAELLATTTWTVTEVATHVGFGSSGQLTRHVRRVLGLTPRQWRAEQAGRGSPAGRT